MKKLLMIILAIASTTVWASFVNPPYPITKGGTGVASQTASRAVTTDGSGNVVSTSATTATEVSYLSGVTSSIQGQFTGKASTALDNIASTALSADLICATTGSCKLGSAAKPFGDSFLNLLKDASSVISIDTLNRTLKNSSGTTVIDFSGATPTLTNPKDANVTNGGNAPYTILATDRHVRTGTTLTAQRVWTLPACVSGNVGEVHHVKDTPAQTFNIVVTAAGSDTIDGSATYTLNPGDAVEVVCGAAAAWDVR